VQAAHFLVTALAKYRPAPALRTLAGDRAQVVLSNRKGQGKVLDQLKDKGGQEAAAKQKLLGRGDTDRAYGRMLLGNPERSVSPVEVAWGSSTRHVRRATATPARALAPPPPTGLGGGQYQGPALHKLIGVLTDLGR
jgi:hypothetical protein